MELHGTERADTLTGTANDDILYGFGGNDTIKGGAGNDVIDGGAGNDKLYGGDGDDYILGGPGDDLIDGGAGNDWASYEDATAGVKVDLTKQGVAQDTGGGGKDTLVGIENLYGSKYADDLTGDDHDNYIYGGDGDNNLHGGKGDDHLAGGSGVDYFFGDEGFDTVDFSGSDKGVTVDIKTVAPPLGGRSGVDMFFSIEAVMGSTHDDTITGNIDGNYLFGDKGNDVIRGVGGGDTLDGGEGNDTIYASSSSKGAGDLVIGGQGRDEVHGSDGVDTFLFNSGDTTWGDKDADIDVIVGFQKTDKLVFSGVTPEAMGSTTVDSLANAHTAATYIMGHAGVIDHHPVVTIAAIQVGADTYVVAGDPNAPGQMFAVKLAGFTATDLTLANFSNNTLAGGDGVDILRGEGGHQILDGGLGNDELHASTQGGDILIGGQGRDVMYGGDGVDTFQFSKGDTTWSASQDDSSVDVIVGFQSQDKLSFLTDGQRIQPGLVKTTANEWLGAAMTAPAEIHNHRTAYVAVQVGDDTYVFASGSTTGASMSAENVVKLIGVHAADLTLANFA